MHIQFDFLGIRAGPRREALKQVFKGLPNLTGTADELLALTQALRQLPEREFQYAAIDLQAKHHKRLDVSALPRILQLVQTDPLWTRSMACRSCGRYFAAGQSQRAPSAVPHGRLSGPTQTVAAPRDHARNPPDATRIFLLQHAEQVSGLTRREAGKHLH